MALKQNNKVRQGQVLFRSGYVYSFQYSNFQFDPEPNIIVINAIKGIHPNTGHKHNYLQAINFTYIPRKQRRLFIKQWINLIKRYNGNVSLSWLDIKRKYPFMELAFRRYFLDKGYIRNVVEISPNDMESVVVKTWEADYSKRALMAAIQKNPSAARSLKEPELVKKIFGGSL